MNDTAVTTSTGALPALQLLDRLLTAEEAAPLVRLTHASFIDLRKRGLGPTATKVGRRVYFDPRDLDEWLAARIVREDAS